MRAVVIRSYGGPEVLEIAEMPEPKPKSNEVVVKVHASGVNPVDWLVRDGAAKAFVFIHFPAILGCELAGEVVEVGAAVTRVRVGDAVFGMMPHDYGAQAERVALAEHLVVPKPASLSMVEAASLPVAALTAINGLRHKGNLAEGERLLVNGAGSAVGMATVQIAKAMGAHVTAVCSKESAPRVKELGADELIDYKEKDFTKSEGRWDFVFDAVGNKSPSECEDVLVNHRVYVTTLPKLGTFARQLINPIAGVKVYGLITTGNGADLEWVKALVEQGKLKPTVDRTFPMAEIAAAHELSKAGRARGKLVLTFR